MHACLRRSSPMVVLPPSRCAGGFVGGTTVYSHCRGIDDQICELENTRDQELSICNSRAAERANREAQAVRERQLEEARQEQAASAKARQYEHAKQQEAANKHLREVQQQQEERRQVAAQERAERQREIRQTQRNNVAEGIGMVFNALTSPEPADEPDYDSDRRQMEAESERRRAAAEERAEKARGEQAKREKIEKEQSLYDTLSEKIREGVEQVQQAKEIVTSDNPFLTGLGVIGKKIDGSLVDSSINHVMPGPQAHDARLDNTSFVTDQMRESMMEGNPFASVIAGQAAGGVNTIGQKIIGNADQASEDIKTFDVDGSTRSPLYNQSKLPTIPAPSNDPAVSTRYAAPSENPFNNTSQAAALTGASGASSPRETQSASRSEGNQGTSASGYVATRNSSSGSTQVTTFVDSRVADNPFDVPSAPRATQINASPTPSSNSGTSASPSYVPPASNAVARGDKFTITYIERSSQKRYVVPKGSVLYRDPTTKKLSVITIASLSKLPEGGDNPAMGLMGCSTTGLGLVTPTCEAARNGGK